MYRKTRRNNKTTNIETQNIETQNIQKQVINDYSDAVQDLKIFTYDENTKSTQATHSQSAVLFQ